jgi:chemotaxis response regulator CheB
MIEVLVVEDSRVIRDYLVYVLETDPQIRSAAPPAAARKRWRASPDTGPT